MITSKDNKRVKEWTKLRLKKYRLTHFLTTDMPTILLAKENGYLETLLYVKAAPFNFTNQVEVSAEVMEKICGEKVAYAAVLRKAEEKFVASRRILLLDGLQDPLNIGLLLGNAQQFGFSSVVFSPNTADIYHEKALQASHGAFYKLASIRQDLPSLIERLKHEGYACYATGLWENTKPLSQIKAATKMAIVVGNEGSGVTKEVREACGESVKIEMQNIDSLNAAVAGSIVMYYFRLP